jgi:hypothetical protein
MKILKSKHSLWNCTFMNSTSGNTAGQGVPDQPGCPAAPRSGARRRPLLQGGQARGQARGWCSRVCRCRRGDHCLIVLIGIELFNNGVPYRSVSLIRDHDSNDSATVVGFTVPHQTYHITETCNFVVYITSSKIFCQILCSRCYNLFLKFMAFRISSACFFSESHYVYS